VVSEKNNKKRLKLLIITMHFLCLSFFRILVSISLPHVIKGPIKRVFLWQFHWKNTVDGRDNYLDYS